MQKKEQLAKNTIIITFSRLSTQLVNFFLLPVYTSLLSTEEYGIVDLITTYVSLLTPIISLQLESAVFRFLIDVRKNVEKKREYISTVIFGIFAQVSITLIIFGALSLFINSSYSFYLLFNVLVHVFALIVLQISRGFGDNITYAIGNAIISISMTVLNIIFVVFLRLGIDGILMGYFLANMMAVIFVFFRKKLYQYISIKEFNFQSYKDLLKYSVPLVPNQLSWWVINASDRSIISIFLGVSANGIYAASNKFSSVFIQLYNIFNLAWQESASLYIDEEESEDFFNDTINAMFNIFLSICLLIISILPFVFPLFVNEKFSEAYVHIPILLLATLFNVVIGLISVVYIAKKLTRKVANTSILSGIINIVISLSLINTIGLFAASLSTLIAYFCLMILRYKDVQKYMRIRFDKRTVTSSIIVMIILLFSYYSGEIILQVIMIVVIVGYVLLLNFSTISDVYEVIKNRFSK